MNDKDLEKLHEKIDLLIEKNNSLVDTLILQNQDIKKMNEIIIELIGYFKIRNNR